YIERDLFRKPVSTFRHHAQAPRPAAVLNPSGRRVQAARMASRARSRNQFDPGDFSGWGRGGFWPRQQMTGRRSPTVKEMLHPLGPGLLAGAADDDPSGIATFSQTGAELGYALCWTMFLTTPFMVAIQIVSARMGSVTGRGLAANLGEMLPRAAVYVIIAVVVAADM